ncbi:MAG TPA: NAD-dependent epimerase/dehydratase family protein [Terriglobales bacterium]|nr:NAD-dependent epimerase/dehydratase family protein [Terriglobales bacterium]
MSEGKQRVLITGVSGNLGTRVLSQLADFDVIGVDLAPPSSDKLSQFEAVDLGDETASYTLMRLLRQSDPYAVVHLAFVIDPVRTGVLDKDRMWHINVAGTARVMEAITEVNRVGGAIRKFIFPSSVSAYGSDLPLAVTEDQPLRGHTLPYAIHKRESDLVAQLRAMEISKCRSYILRPHIYAGASVQNYLMGAFRGTPSGMSQRAQTMRAEDKHLPSLLPMGRRYLDNRIQFVHVDVVARLIAYLLRRREEDPQLTILNVAGRGEPLTFGQCVQISGNQLVRVPGKLLFRSVLALLWKLGISGIPPEAAPYMTGTYIMDTSRLRAFLGEDYENVIRYTVKEAFADSFRAVAPKEQTVEHTAAG